MMGLTLRWVLGMLDTGAAVILLWATLKITNDFGIRTREKRWALIRRIVNYCAVLALLYLGLGRLDGRYPIPSFDQFAAGSALAFYVLFYPLLRAFGYTTQDELLDRPPPQKRSQTSVSRL